MVKKQCERQIKKIAAGDKEALAKLYETAGRAMFVVAQNVLRDYQLAEDATQEALIKIISRAKTLEDTKAAYSWILTITRNCALDILRKNVREIAMDEENYNNYPADNNNLDIRIDIENAIDKLNEIDRQIVILRAFSGLSYKEIALVVELTEAACQKRYQRAIKQLKELML